MPGLRSAIDRVVRWYLDKLMHVATSVAIMQVLADWVSGPEHKVLPLIQKSWVTASLFSLFLVELLLRTFYMPQWPRLRGLRARTRWEAWRHWLGEAWFVLRTQVFDRWYLFDVVALVSFLRFEQLRVLRGLRSARVVLRWARMSRMARVAKHFRPRLASGGLRLPGGPYTWLFAGNLAVLVAAALTVAALEECSFGKAFSWTAQVFYGGESFWTQLTNPKARAFGDLVKIPGMAFYALFIGLVPDLLRRGQRLLTALRGLRHHYVVFGWNEYGYRLLRDLLSAAPRLQRRTIVVGEGGEPGEVQDLGVKFLSGPLSSLLTLERAAVHSATVVIMPPAQRPAEHGGRVDPVTFLLASHMATASRERNASRLVACTASPRTHDLVESLGGMAVDACLVGGRLLSQALIKPGVEAVLEELMSLRGASIFVEPVPRRWADRTFLDYARAACGEPARPLGLVRDGAVVLLPDPDIAQQPLRESQALVCVCDGPGRVNLPLSAAPAPAVELAPGDWSFPWEAGHWTGKKLLVLGWNPLLDYVLRGLRCVPAKVHVAVHAEEVRARLAHVEPYATVAAGPIEDADFLAQWVGDESLAGILVLADAEAVGDRGEGASKGGLALLQIRELERRLGRPRHHVVFQTTSVADHHRLRRINGLDPRLEAVAESSESSEDLGLVCVEEACALLAAQAVGTRRVVEVFEDIVNATAGCGFDLVTFASGRGDVAFRDVLHAFASGAGVPGGAPIGILRGQEAILSPPVHLSLARGDQVVYLRRA